MPFLKYRSVGIIAGLIFVAFLFVCGCGKETGAKLKTDTARSDGRPKNEEILVRIGDDVITTADYKAEFTTLPPAYRDIARFRKGQFLESLINKHLLLQEAERRRLQNSDVVKRLLRRAEEEIMIQELINKEVSDNAEPIDSEIEKYYQENQGDYIEPARIRASHILVDSEVIVVKILDDLKRSGDFVELAREYSLDIPTKDKGGDLGYFTEGTLLPDFEEACGKLGVGEVSGAVKTDLGYHVIKILDKKEAKQKTLEEARDDIKSKLLLDKQVLLYGKLLQKLKEKQEISINKELLETIDLSL